MRVSDSQHGVCARPSGLQVLRAARECATDSSPRAVAIVRQAGSGSDTLSTLTHPQWVSPSLRFLRPTSILRTTLRPMDRVHDEEGQGGQQGYLEPAV